MLQHTALGMGHSTYLQTLHKPQSKTKTQGVAPWWGSGQSKIQTVTCPCAAVELDSHAGGLGMNAIRHKANSSSDDWWIKFT